MRIFLSSPSEQESVAEPILLSLRDRGYTVFYSEDELPPRESFDLRIKQSPRFSDLFIFLVSPESVSKGRYTLTELTFARQKWPESEWTCTAGYGGSNFVGLYTKATFEQWIFLIRGQRRRRDCRRRDRLLRRPRAVWRTDVSRLGARLWRATGILLSQLSPVLDRWGRDPWIAISYPINQHQVERIRRSQSARVCLED